jgi:DNA repair exonuclease SbcCD nuclease subunit
MDKLRRIADIGAEAGVDAYTCGGDWFQEKVPAKTSHSMVNELMSVIKSFSRPCFSVVGNHDLQYDRTSTMVDQPLGPLVNSGHLVLQCGQVIKGDGGPAVMLHGFDFAEEPDYDSIALSGALKDKARYHVLSLHVYASPSGGSLHGKTRVHSYRDLLSLGYDVVLLGHYHADQGCTVLTREDMSTCTFVNIGSLSRGDYGDENIHRIPKCCIVEFSEQGVFTREIPVGAKPAAEVFDLEEKAATKEKEQEAAAFVENLKNAEVVAKRDDETPEQLLDRVPIDDVAVLAKTKEFLQRAAEVLKKNGGTR